MQKPVFAFFVSFLCLCSVFASTTYKFRTLSPDGGFYYDGVNSIQQDGQGFIWVGMDYELYRFDGYEYKKYYPAFAAMDSTRRWIFHNMVTDDSGQLYVNTNNGVYQHLELTDRFVRRADGAIRIATDKKNRLWTYRNGRWQLNRPDGTNHVPTYENDCTSAVNIPFVVHNEDLYSFVGRKIYRYHEADSAFVYCSTLPGKGKGIRFAQSTMGKLWVFVIGEGIYQLDLSTFQIDNHYPVLTDYVENTIRDFYLDKNGIVWLGTMDGLCLFNPQEKQLTFLRHREDDKFSLPNNSIWTISEDRQRNVWIGTHSGALCYVNMDEESPFRSYHAGSDGLIHPTVSAFAIDGDQLWVGTEGGGICKLDEPHQRFQSVLLPDAGGASNVKSLLMDHRHRLWISTYQKGLICYDIDRESMRSYLHTPKDSCSLWVNDVRKAVLDGDSGIWVAYQHPRPVLSYYSFYSDSFTHVELDNTNNYAYLFDLVLQGDNTLWAITNEALYQMNIETRKTKKIVLPQGRYGGFFSMTLDDSGNLWIGTIGHGLFKYDTRNARFIPQRMGRMTDLSSIYSICYDDGRVWMGTNEGLYCYEPSTGHLVVYDEAEDTQGQVYYPLASMKGTNGLLYFGGTNGFTILQPSLVKMNTNVPQALVTNFYIDHQPVYPNFDCGAKELTWTLDYDQPNFGFTFSSDNYHIPQQNHYKYRLRGYQNEWVSVDASQRTVMFSKVPAGTYYFEVLVSNSNGVWSEHPTRIKVVRRVKPWLCGPAYLLYFLALLGVVYVVYRHYADKKRLELLLYQEDVEREKEEQIHQAQLRFFTNISHDFRTPLSLIMAAVDKLRRDGLKEYYYRILNGNVQRLLNLVNELMDFRTIENGMMKLELEPLSINEVVWQIADDFVDYARDRGIDFRVKCDEQLPSSVYADRHVVEKVVMNLLNNAFRYTQGRGTICLETRMGHGFHSPYSTSFSIGENTGPVYSIIVSDTGVGISAESIPQVFERFYRVNTVNADAHLGTGIGLALVKSLVLLHKGMITIYSERNVGTDMVVTLPLDKMMFTATQFKNTQPEAQPEEPSDAGKDCHAMDGPGQAPFSSTRKKILVTEDNHDLRMLIAESLADEFEVFQAADGVEALSVMNQEDVDLVISDIMMPRKDGVTLCHELKNDINTSHIPVVLLTAKTSLESKIEGVDSGADLYFEKPIDFTYLKLSILNIFRNRQQLREHYAKHYYADSSELATNEQDGKFLKRLVDYIDAHIDNSQLDVESIADEMVMSRSKLYNKVKGMTGKSVVEFVLNCRLRKAAKLIIEKDLTMREIMMEVGIESQAYFTNSFKKVFGETPTSFAKKHKDTNGKEDK